MHLCTAKSKVISMSTNIRAYVSVCQSVFYLCVSVCLSICLSVSVCLSFCLSFYLFVSVCLSVCLSFCMSVCLSICLSVSVSLFVHLRAVNEHKEVFRQNRHHFLRHSPHKLLTMSASEAVYGGCRVGKAGCTWCMLSQ